MSKKIQDNEDFKDFLEVLEHHLDGESDLVVSSFITRVSSFLQNKVFQSQSCESPIEKSFFLALDDLKGYNETHGVKTKIFLQQEVDVKGKNYRVDFIVVCRVLNGENFAIAIECDGHDFHEKTKEQAARDKKRDRDLVSRGLTVMRFTGSEIYKDAEGCAWEVIDFITNKVVKEVKEENWTLFN